MTENFLTSEQVAKILQVHPFTVLKLIKSKRLQAIKIGRMYRIKEADLENFTESLSQKVEDTSAKRKPTGVAKTEGSALRIIKSGSGKDHFVIE
ncbi:MAG: helix-turn-helix domain-containing protein [Candidatus Gracilibacteria bacterium]|jgi:excisionase family DNA binding protein|nr:MAG: DNA-binding protein, excisionase family [Candidatus Peregrinibacteria bacterium GW2011_GWA2_38_36]KKR06650.1 MAG: hypothetical protein UT33_C0009G0101 [Candidatus Peregrinibacteria bacterium GW2011_GWC2_39_14]